MSLTYLIFLLLLVSNSLWQSSILTLSSFLSSLILWISFSICACVISLPPFLSKNSFSFLQQTYNGLKGSFSLWLGSRSNNDLKSLSQHRSSFLTFFFSEANLSVDIESIYCSNSARLLDLCCNKLSLIPIVLMDSFSLRGASSFIHYSTVSQCFRFSVFMALLLDIPESLRDTWDPRREEFSCLIRPSSSLTLFLDSKETVELLLKRSETVEVRSSLRMSNYIFVGASLLNIMSLLNLRVYSFTSDTHFYKEEKQQNLLKKHCRMNNRIYEGDLLERYRQSISKRYKGYTQKQTPVTLNSDQARQMSGCQNKQINHSKCNSDNELSQKNGVIVIRSTNARIHFGPLNKNDIPLCNDKKFVRKKYLSKMSQDNNFEFEDPEQRYQSADLLKPITKSSKSCQHVSTKEKEKHLQQLERLNSVIQMKLQYQNQIGINIEMQDRGSNGRLNDSFTNNSHCELNQEQQKVVLNKLKYRKKINREKIQKLLNIDEKETNFETETKAFSPLIKGQKKIACHTPTHTQFKVKTYQNEVVARDHLSVTELQNKKIRLSNEKLTTCKVDLTEFKDTTPNCERLIDSVNTTQKVQVKSTRNPNDQNLGSNKNSESGSIVKISLPKIKEKENKKIRLSTKTSTEREKAVESEKQRSLEQVLQQESTKNQKYQKVPLLLKHQFNSKSISSESYIVMQASSTKVLWGHRSSHTYEIASLTKIMTFYTVMKIAEQSDISPQRLNQEMYEVPKKCTSIGGTSAELYLGEVYSITELLHGLMLPSGNDAALALAAWGGSRTLNKEKQIVQENKSNAERSEHSVDAAIKRFMKKMNQLCSELQLSDSRFGNPHGLPHRDSRSSVYDVAKLCAICMQNELFRKVVSTEVFKCHSKYPQTFKKKRVNQWENTHKLLRREGFIGIKTGITITAGPCLATAYEFRGRTYICVILRAKKVSRRFKETRRLLHWCLSKLYEGELTKAEEQILKRLKRSNVDLDSDYSEDEHEFRYDKNNSREYQKRCQFISEM